MSCEPVNLPDSMRSRSWYGEQEEDVVDPSLIRENLKLTPLGRIRRGDRARPDALRLRELGRGSEKGQFEQIVERFIRHGVKLIVVGGQAQTPRGSPRVTCDADLC